MEDAVASLLSKAASPKAGGRLPPGTALCRGGHCSGDTRVASRAQPRLLAASSQSRLERLRAAAGGSCDLALPPCALAPPRPWGCLGRCSQHSKSMMRLSGLDPEVLTIFHILQNLKKMLKDYINSKKSVLLLLKKLGKTCKCC